MKEERKEAKSKTTKVRPARTAQAKVPAKKGHPLDAPILKSSAVSPRSSAVKPMKKTALNKKKPVASAKVVSKPNTTVPATDAPQLFRAKVKVYGDGVTQLDERDVFFLVPPAPFDDPIF